MMNGILFRWMLTFMTNETDAERQANTALTHYALDDVRLAFLSHTHNYVYAVHSRQGDFILRLLPLIALERVEKEVQYLHTLAAHVSVPRVQATRSGERYVVMQTGVALLLERLSGSILNVESVSELAMERFGVVLAALHGALPTVTDAPNEMQALFDATGAYPVEALMERLSSDQQLILTDVMEWLRPLLTRPFSEAAGLLHGDYVLHNLLVEADGRIHLIDLEYSRYGQRWYDVGTLLWQVRVREDWRSLEEAFLTGYGDQTWLEPWLVVRHIASLHWIAHNRDAQTIAPHADRILAQRLAELNTFRFTHTLDRKPFMP